MDDAEPTEPRLGQEDQDHSLCHPANSKRRFAANTVDLESGAAERRKSEVDLDSDVSVTNEDDGLQARRRSSGERRPERRLPISRCVCALLVLCCVYGVMALHHPSSGTLLDPTPPQSIETAYAAASNSTTTSTTRSLEEVKALRMAALPKFGKPQTTTATAAVHKAKYHSTIPPDAVNGVTHINGTITHWHKIPPTIYKKQRPILSHAHSYQSHQSPLVFGREDSPSFDERSSSSTWKRRFNSCFLWISLIVLIKTTYREWQQYRFQQLTGVNPWRQRRYRRSPSPRGGSYYY